MIRIAIAGCNGKMGRQLIQSISQMHGVKLTAAFVREGSSLIGCDAGELVGIGKCGVNITDSPYHAKDKFDVLIDFTRPTGTLTYLSFCVEHQKMMVIGTTGFSDNELEQIKQAAEHIGIVFSANFSIGVNLLLKLLETTTAVIGEETDIEIIEAHHRHKVDSPSGTALAMGNIIAQTLGQDLKKQAVFCRNGDTGARTKNEIGFSAIRAGDIIGEHTALFAAIGERIEITHKASNRMTFSNGAVRAAMWLPTKPIGLYDMQDVLNLSNK